MRKNVVVLGAQWGDEGKGKIVDLLTDKIKVVVRYQGGNNAGHTIIVDDEKYILHLIPSGILRPEVECFIGHGVVLAPSALLTEISLLEKRNLSISGRLKISASCNILLPYHIALDKAREQARGKAAIGTTGRGIGPAYEDKAARRGIRAMDLLNSTDLSEKLSTLADYHNFQLTQYYQAEAIPVEPVLESLLQASEKLCPMLEDVPFALHEYCKKEVPLLFEGAQGVMLDIDVGTYPFVTSSNTTVGAVFTGAGFGPLDLGCILGVTKAYVTRVGQGPFPTELYTEEGEMLAQRGKEFGSTTGRSRRCGWLDIPLLRRALLSNSFTHFALMKLDVLDAFQEIKLCTAYKLHGKKLEIAPLDPSLLDKCEPIYETFPGWLKNTQGVMNYKQLPTAAQTYVEAIERACGVPIALISTGPQRAQTINRVPLPL